jgi:hypothetical protein
MARKTLPHPPLFPPPPTDPDVLTRVIGVLCSYAEARLAAHPHAPSPPPDVATDSHTNAAAAAALNASVGEMRELLSIMRKELHHPEKGTRAPPSALFRVFPEHSVIPFVHSLLIREVPHALAELSARNWSLLYRGSLHGFHACNFHDHCDGKANTLTIIQSKEETGFPSRIFGGFTPVRWESRGDARGGPHAAGSFLFNLNPADGGAPRKYPIRTGHFGEAIFCRDNLGPTFGKGCDIYTCNNCDTARGSQIRCGTSYESDGKEENHNFALSQNFLVQEIEVFELS